MSPSLSPTRSSTAIEDTVLEPLHPVDDIAEVCCCLDEGGDGDGGTDKSFDIVARRPGWKQCMFHCVFMGIGMGMGFVDIGMVICILGSLLTFYRYRKPVQLLI